jgi:hypothetical protein
MNPDFGGGPVALDDINRHKIAYSGALSELESCCPQPSTRAAFANQISALAARTAKEAGEAADYLKNAGKSNQALVKNIEKIESKTGHANKSDDLKIFAGRTTCIGANCFGEGASVNNQGGALDQGQGVSGNSKADTKKSPDSNKGGELNISDLNRKIADLGGSINEKLIQARTSGKTLSAIEQGQIKEGSISAQRLAAVAAKVKEGKPLNLEEQQIQLFDLNKRLAALKRGAGISTRGTQKSAGTSALTEVSYQNVGGSDGTLVAVGAGNADTTMTASNSPGQNAGEALPETVNLNAEFDLFKQVSTRYQQSFFPLFQEE